MRKTNFHGVVSKAWTQNFQFSSATTENDPDPATTQNIASDTHRLVKEIHHQTVVKQRSLLNCLTRKERELFDAASETEPRSAVEISSSAGHDLNGNTKEMLSILTRFGLFDKAGGRGGYLKSHIEERND